MFSIF
jgi:hypothetical protein